MRGLARAYRNMILLMLAAVPVGLAAGLVGVFFGTVLGWMTSTRLAHPYALIPFLGVGGAVIAWAFRRLGGKSVKGMSLIFEAGHGATDDIPLRLIPLAMCGTWLTHLFGGSSGREGVALQIGGTMGYAVGKALPLKNADRLLLIAGMAAGYAGLFRTPMTATFFAIEVFTAGYLEYRAIMPAMVAAFAASFLSGVLGWKPFVYPLAGTLELTPLTGARLIVIGAMFGVLGGVFAWALHHTRDALARLIPSPVLRSLIVGTALGALLLVFWGGRYSGSSAELIVEAIEGRSFRCDFILKAVLTVLTLAVGFLGGEVVPLFATGACFGALVGPSLGLPMPFAAALGSSAVFCGATNTLLGAIAVGCELFGFAHMPLFFIVCAAAYVCNGNASIYQLQKRENLRDHA